MFSSGVCVWELKLTVKHKHVRVVPLPVIWLLLKTLTNKRLSSTRVRLLFRRDASVVEHLRDFHGEVQALRGREADVAAGAVAEEAARAWAAGPRELQERPQGAGLAAEQRRAQRAEAHGAPSEGLR